MLTGRSRWSRRPSGDAAVQGPYRRAAEKRPEPEATGNAAARFGIKARLFLAFCAMAAMTAIASAIAGTLSHRHRPCGDADHHRQHSRYGHLLRLAGTSAEIAATAPALGGTSQDERERFKPRLEERTEELIALTGDLAAVGVHLGADRRSGRRRSDHRAAEGSTAVESVLGSKSRREAVVTDLAGARF